MIRELTIAVAAFLVILAMLVPRKYLIVPFILAACFVPTDQRILVMGLNFTVLRVLVVIGLLRLAFQPKRIVRKWNNFDKMITAWAICGAIIYCIQWGDTKAMINRSGVLFDILGLYLIFRENLSSWENIIFNFKVFAVCSIIMAVFVGIEYSTGSSPFIVLGKVTTELRESRYRCQGSFPHSIMLGLFWASLVPVLAVLAKTEKPKLLYVAGLAACTFIVIASASSTPVLVLVVVVAGLFVFNLRRYTGPVCLTMVGVFAIMHLVMKAPVWHLLARVNVVGGSTGWHRYYLIDKAIAHFGEWAVIGCRSTAGWGTGLADITNQFVLEGVRGGLITLFLFIIMLYMAFKIILNCSFRCETRNEKLLVWSFFVAMMGHCVGFLGVSYFGQIMMLFYMALAIVRFLSEYKPDMQPAFVKVFDERPLHIRPELYSRF